MPAFAISQPVSSAAQPAATRLRRPPAICALVADAPAALRTRSSALAETVVDNLHHVITGSAGARFTPYVAHQPLNPTAGLCLRTGASRAFQPRRRRCSPHQQPHETTHIPAALKIDIRYPNVIRLATGATPVGKQGIYKSQVSDSGKNPSIRANSQKSGVTVWRSSRIC